MHVRTRKRVGIWVVACVVFASWCRKAHKWTCWMCTARSTRTCVCSLSLVIALRMRCEYSAYYSPLTCIEWDNDCVHTAWLVISFMCFETDRQRTHTSNAISTRIASSMHMSVYARLASFIINAFYYETDSVRLVIILPFQWQQVVILRRQDR